MRCADTCGTQGGVGGQSAPRVETSVEPACPSFMEDEVSAANAAKQRQQQRAETIRCCAALLVFLPGATKLDIASSQ